MLDSRGASAVSPTSESEVEELHQSTKMSIDITSFVSKVYQDINIKLIIDVDYRYFLCFVLNDTKFSVNFNEICRS